MVRQRFAAVSCQSSASFAVTASGPNAGQAAMADAT